MRKKRNTFFALIAHVFAWECLFLSPVLAAVTAFPAVKPLEGNFVRWEMNYGLDSPNEPVVGDFNWDGHLEIFLSDRVGHILLVKASDGSTIWRKNLPGAPMLQPVPGQFVTTSTLEIAILRRDGRLAIISGVSGRVLLNTQTEEQSLNFSLPPTLVPAQGTDRFDSVLAVSDDRRLFRFSARPEGRLDNLFFNRAITQIDSLPLQPICVGWFQKGGALTRGFAFPSLERNSILANLENSDQPATAIPFPPNSGDQCGMALLPDAQGVVREVALLDTLGNLYSLAADFNGAEPRLLQSTTVSLRTDCPMDKEHVVTPIVADLDGDGKMDMVVVGHSKILTLLGPEHAPLGNGYVTARGFQTPPALFFAKHGLSGKVMRPIVMIGDEAENLHFLDPLSALDDPSLQHVKVGRFAPVSPVVLDPDGSGMAHVLVITDRLVCMLKTIFLTDGSAVLWPQAGGGPLRSGGISATFESVTQVRRGLQREVQAARMTRARDALAARKYKEALAAANTLLEINPFNPEAKHIQNKALIGQYRFSLIFLLIMMAVGLVPILIIGRRMMAVRLLLRWTQDMANQNNPDAARAAFEDYFRRHSGPHAVIERLAEYAERFKFDPLPFLPILEKGLKASPEDKFILLGVARAYLAQGNFSLEAFPVYEKARLFAEDSAPFLYALGQIQLNEGKADEARERLETALQLNYHPPELLDALCHVYISLHILNPRYLPVYETAAKRHPTDRNVLEALARVYVAGNMQNTPKAQKAFEALKQSDAASVLANQELAAARYRQGEFDKAREFAQTALEGEPGNSASLRILAWCLWREKDFSPAARNIYFQASELFPDDPLLLRSSAQMLLEMPDRPEYPEPPSGAVHAAPRESALARVARAIQQNTSDREFLKTAAIAATRWGERPLLRTALEFLCQLRELEKEQKLQLAEIYSQDGEFPPDNLNVLSEAFSLQPSMPGLAPLLGRAIVQMDKIDPTNIAVFEHLYHITPSTPAQALSWVGWGIVLGKFHAAQGHFESVKEILHQVQDEIGCLEKIQGENSLDPLVLKQRRTEVDRLLAAASSKLKNYQEAVERYQSILASAPGDEEAALGLGRTLASQEKLDPENQEIISRAHRSAPRDPQLCLAMAEYDAKEERWTEAGQHLMTALEAGEDYPRQVLDRVDAMVRRCPPAHSIPPRWIRVQVLTALKRYGDLLEEAETIASLSAREINRLLGLFEHILKIEPGNPDAMLGLGKMLHRENREQQARETLENILKQDRENESARALLVEIYESILKSSPDDSSVRFSLGLLAMQLGDFNRAVTCFQKTRLDSKLSKVSARYLAECYFHKNMIELALQEFQSLPVDSGIAPMIYQIGVESEIQGNRMAARIAYERVYAFDATFRDVAQRLNDLSQANTSAGALSRVDQGKTFTTEGLSAQARLRYDIREELGRGAMATVFRAYDNELDEDVALKVLPESFLNNPDAVRRFRLEARSARKLTNPHIVRIHDIGEEQGRKYISMEYIDGETLKKIIHAPNITLTLPMFLNYARQISSAMAYAHECGIVHRDLKPANIMIARTEDGSLENGIVKVTDFGIAKAIDNTGQTVAGAIVGTPLYMSPEQVLGQGCDQRADIYSFGIVLYEMATGTPPFHDGDLAYHHLHTAPAPIPDIPPRLNALILKCLQKDRDVRWNNFGEILRELDAVEKEAENEEN